jgi:hypothetical protein
MKRTFTAKDAKGAMFVGLFDQETLSGIDPRVKRECEIVLSAYRSEPADLNLSPKSFSQAQLL